VTAPLAASLWLLLAAPPAWAQFGAVRPAERLTAGQRANAFVQWGGASAIDGVLLDLPSGWSLVSARAVPAGTAPPVPMRVAPVEGAPARYLAMAPAAVRGPHLVVLGIAVGEPTPFAEATLTPVRRSGARLLSLSSYQTAWGTAAAEAAPARGRAFARSGDAAPLALDRRSLPGMHGDHAYTLEAWIKTTGLREVVLSTWDGRPDQTYPVEWTVDTRGRLLAYRGEPGRHLGMRTSTHVADGRWHHIAVVQDPARGWARLYVDGQEEDSLRIADSGLSNNVLPLALGGRRARAREARGAPHYTGLIDELRIWGVARSASELRYAMRLPLEARVARLVRVGFDTAVPGSLLAEAAGRVYAPSDLSFWFPIEALNADVVEGVVRLTWDTRDRQSDRFVVERSADGRAFTAIGEVRPADRVAEAADGTMRFSFADPMPSSPLLYYRIRQRGGGAPDRLSGSLKLGRGGDGALLARIVGNAPNPFRDETLISFDLAEAGEARVTVWDVSGARVETLVDGSLGAGRHEIRFDGSDLPSGVYFVQLQTPGGRLTHKLTLSR